MPALPIRKEYRELQPADLMRSFLLFKKAAGLSPRTITDYEAVLSRFFHLYPDALDFPRERTMEHLSSYENPSSYNLRYAYLKCFWDWCAAEGNFRGSRHPLDGLKKRKPRGRIVQLSESEIRCVLRQPNKREYAGVRDYALLCLSIDTGIRPGEALSLSMEDYDAAKGEIIVRAESAKTRTPRTLPLSEETVQAIKRLLEVRPEEWSGAPIFCSSYGEPYQVREWSRRVKMYGKKCGLEITAYHLRHAAALLLLRRGADAFSLQAIMGHSTMSMTRHYIALTNEDMKKAHKSAGVLHAVLGEEEDAPVKRKKLRLI